MRGSCDKEERDSACRRDNLAKSVTGASSHPDAVKRGGRRTLVSRRQRLLEPHIASRRLARRVVAVVQAMKIEKKVSPAIAVGTASASKARGARKA